MEELKKQRVLRMIELPALRRTPLLSDAAAFAVLGCGGYAALRLADLILRALGAA